MIDILDETLGDMSSIRQAIALRFKWYYHVTPARNADSIRRKGIIPKSDAAPPDQALRHIGCDAGKIICLSPLGADCVPPTVQQGPFICLALSTETLPHKIGLDWSHDGAVGIARVLRNERPDRSADAIFVEAVKRWGSMLSYEPIRIDGLRVCCKGCLPHDPARWPMLVGAANDCYIHF
jgi:hypothetical protein